MAKRGETKEKILNAATKVFFEKGFEAASVKMILDEAGAVTGSFYHYFASKEELFEQVVARFLTSYTEKISAILKDDTLSPKAQLEAFMQEIQNASNTYYRVLGGEHLHWTVQHALHNKTLEALVMPLAEMLARRMGEGMLESRLDINALTLAAILIRGIEAIFYADGQTAPERFGSKTAAKNIREFIGLLLIVHPTE